MYNYACSLLKILLHVNHAIMYFFTVPFIYGMNSIATLFNLSHWVAIEFILYRLICYYRLSFSEYYDLSISVGAW